MQNTDGLSNGLVPKVTDTATFAVEMLNSALPLRVDHKHQSVDAL
jgi:hypothetical protein